MMISKVSEKYGLSKDTLRYYENVGLIPRVNRNDSGIRDYTEIDCGWIEFIKCMRDAGLSVKTLIEYVRLFQMGEETVEARKKLLIEQRELLVARMADMQKTLNRLNYKIEKYEKIVEKEKELKIPDDLIP